MQCYYVGTYRQLLEVLQCTLASKPKYYSTIAYSNMSHVAGGMHAHDRGATVDMYAERVLVLSVGPVLL